MGGAILWIIIKGAVFQPSVLGTNLTDDALSQLMAVLEYSMASSPHLKFISL